VPYLAALVLVEGRDDAALVRRIAANLGLTIQVQLYGGKAEFRGYIKALALEADFRQVRSLGVTRDADDDPDAAWMSMVGALRDAGLTPPQEQLVSTGASPRITGLLVPRHGPGYLEDVLLQAIAGDPALACVEDLLTCAGRSTPTSKHRLHAFLCTRDGVPFGVDTALERGDIPATAPAYSDLEQLVRDVALT
jgi:hypothetical protein